MVLAIQELGGNSMDVISKAREVVKDAQIQQFILL